MKIIEKLKAEREKRSPGSDLNILFCAFLDLKSKKKIEKFISEYIKTEDSYIPRPLSSIEARPALLYIVSMLREYVYDGAPHFPEHISPGKVRDIWDDVLVSELKKIGKSSLANEIEQELKARPKLRIKQEAFNEYLTRWERFRKLRPLKYSNGVSIYSGGDLGDLVETHFPMTISQKGWEIELNNPTHRLYFSRLDDGNYRLDLDPRPIKKLDLK